jgi:HK97 family phage prohead protease
MAEKYDFSGWASRYDVPCSDGRTIRKNAFKDMDGMEVPLIWGHNHDTPTVVLGKARIQHRDKGPYIYASFNNTEEGQHAKEAVQHGDVKYLSIFANKLKEAVTSRGRDVLHGTIREVSLVYGGANPGAYIDNAVLAHSDGTYDMVDDEAVICFFDEIEPYIEHSEKGGEMEDNNANQSWGEEVFDSMTDDQKDLVYQVAEEYAKQVVNELSEEDPDDEHDEDEEYDEGEEYDEDYDEDGEAEHSDYEGDEEMKHNVFDVETNDGEFLSHDEMATIIADGKKYGSMKESFLAHADDYGIQQIDWLFPDVKNLNNPPEYIKRPDDWVSIVMNGVHHSPFSRIKSTYADITEDEARARGYLKGKLKKEEVFSLLKRSTIPTTVYKKQKLDRDDTIDITDFDVIAWLKAEMRGMLDEELAGAYLFGDGRLASDDDHINTQNIRPIVNDADLFTIKYAVAPSQAVAAGTPIEDSAQYYVETMIKAAIRARKGYKGSGQPTLFTSESVLCEMLLLEDTQKHPLYKTEAELATKMRVSRIVTIPDEILARGSYDGKPVLGLIVNLNDYNVGADKGGAVNMFDDFDIDYNQMKYLIETRCSGALIKPFSAITLYADTQTKRTSKIVGDEGFKAADIIGE